MDSCRKSNFEAAQTATRKVTHRVRRALPAELSLLTFIDDLARKNAHCVGFLPLTAYKHALESDRVLLLLENDQPAGYLIHGPEIRNSKIYQVVVSEDLRRIEHGTALVDELKRHYETHEVHTITCHVAEDLEANSFWKAIGFQHYGRRTKDSRGRRWQNRYHFELPATAQHIQAAQAAIAAAGMAPLAEFLLMGGISVADAIHKPPRARQRLAPTRTEATCS